MKTYRLICKVAGGGRSARFVNVRNDRAATDRAKETYDTDNYVSVEIRDNRRLVARFGLSGYRLNEIIQDAASARRASDFSAVIRGTMTHSEYEAIYGITS